MNQAPKAGTLGQPRRIAWGGDGRGFQDAGEGDDVYLWLIHVGVWHKYHNIVEQLSSN